MVHLDIYPCWIKDKENAYLEICCGTGEEKEKDTLSITQKW